MTSHLRLFNFIEKVSNELLDLVTQLEEALFKQPQTVLMQARLYTEQLVKLISKEERLEEVYPIKHAERIYRLYRQNAIEEEIYIKLEWIRKQGNKAAHDVSSVSFEDGFKAHKYLFDISVWYMQLYVNYDFEAPIYKLPVIRKEENVPSTQDLNEAIKPFLDQSFKQMDEMRKEIQRELEEIKKAHNRVAITVDAPQAEARTGTHFPLLNYLQEQQIPYVDKRDRKGALWVIGGWELNEKLFPLKEHKIYFRYMKKGGRATNYEPAWFLLTKNLVDPSAEGSVLEEKEHPSEQPTLTEIEEMEQMTVSLEEVAADYWRSAGQLLVPYSLLDQAVDQFPLEGLQRLQKHVTIQTFRDLTEDHLRTVYKRSREDFHYMVQDLYWLGCRFTDRLASFQPVPMAEPEHRFVVKGTGQEELQSLLPSPIVKTLAAKGLSRLRDLHDYLSESVKWLTKIEAQNLVDLLPESYRKPVVPSALNEADTVEVADKPEEALVLSFQGETLEIRNDLVRTPVNELGITGCNNMIRQLTGLNIHTLRDFEIVLDGLHNRLQSVGAKTVEKFWTQLVELHGDEPAPSHPSHDSEGNKLVYLYGKTLVIPPTLLATPLRLEDFPGIDNAVERMMDSGVTTLGELPTQFEEIGKLEGIGKTKLVKLFDRLHLLIERAIQQYQLDQLPPEERLAHELSLFEEWIGKLQENEVLLKNEKISPRYMKLMHMRFEASLQGQHVTLEALGEKEGVTRERIRQILARDNQRIVRRLSTLQQFLQKRLEDRHHLMLASFMKPTDFSHFILKNALEEAGFTFLSLDDHILVSDLEKEKVEEYQAGVKEDVEKTFHLHVITPQDFQRYCEEKGAEDGLDVSLIEMIAAPHIKWLSAEQGVLQNLKKYQAVEMVMLQYPEGVEVYKREDELNEKASDLMPGAFTDERDFYAIATRQDLADRIFLWDRGTYIHSTFVTKDKEWVHQVQHLAETWLEREEFIHVAKLYQSVKEEAEKRGVPNEYALYTLIRHYPVGSLALTKFPMIQLAGAERQANADYIEQFIREKGGRASFHEMLELFVEKRGLKRFTLEFTLSSKEQFLQYEHGHYTLLSYYDHIQLEHMPFIVRAIQEKVKETPFFSIHSIFMEHEVVLKSLGIETKQILYTILKKRGGLEVRFPRYPYIVSATHKFDTVSGVHYLEQFILEQEEIVSREEVEAWVEEVFGQNDRILDVALVQVPDILYYTKGQFGEYIHRNNIGLYGEKESHVHEAMRQRFETVVLVKGRTYALLSDLYDTSVLPTLEAGQEWSQDLLGDVLKKSSEWTGIGSYDEIFVPSDHKITNDVTFLEYVLSHHFEGTAKLREFRRFLGDIRYSKDGKLLVAVEEALRTGEAPYVIDGDEIMLVELSKGETT